MINGVIFKKKHDGIYLKCLNCTKADKNMKQLHDKFGITHRAALENLSNFESRVLVAHIV